MSSPILLQREPIKVLHVVFSLDPGGMENGLVNVARALHPAEFEVHVCCLERRGSFADRLPNPRNVGVLNKGEGFSPAVVGGLARLIARLKPHVLHTHNLGSLLYGGLATGFGRWRPILHGEHGSLQPEQLRPRRVWQRRWLYRFCRRVHTVSGGVRQQLIELGFPGSNIEIVINGVDTERFVPGDRVAARRTIGILPETGQIVGIVGRLVALKRHSELIEAFLRLARRRPEVHLLIVGGGGTEEGRIKAQVKAGEMSARIHLAGHQDVLTPYYQAMDLLAVPSIHEGMSNVILEAMACGIPVLAHDVCGNAEVIRQREDGIIAQLDSVEQLETALAETLARPAELARMGLKARENVVCNFSLKRMVEAYAKLYRELSKPEGA